MQGGNAGQDCNHLLMNRVSYKTVIGNGAKDTGTLALFQNDDKPTFGGICKGVPTSAFIGGNEPRLRLFDDKDLSLKPCRALQV